MGNVKGPHASEVERSEPCGNRTHKPQMRIYGRKVEAHQRIVVADAQQTVGERRVRANSGLCDREMDHGRRQRRNRLSFMMGAS